VSRNPNVEALALLIDQLYGATYGDNPTIGGIPSPASVKHATWLAARGVLAVDSLTDEQCAEIHGESYVDSDDKWRAALRRCASGEEP
jgi:hypothetical protein